ncbi:MAG: LacI family DNA-binding transcriptional regulator, partial [Ruthenibacterium sp.]
MVYTIKDIAAEAEVSAAAVSLVLNNKPCRIADKTRRRILEIADKHHYAPNLSARALVLRESKTLGLIIPDISNPYFSELAKGVEREAQRIGYSVIFCNSRDDARKDLDNFKLLLGRQVDAVVLVSSIEDEDTAIANEFNHLATANGVPVVLFDRQVIGGNYDTV